MSSTTSAGAWSASLSRTPTTRSVLSRSRIVSPGLQFRPALCSVGGSAGELSAVSSLKSTLPSDLPSMGAGRPRDHSVARRWQPSRHSRGVHTKALQIGDSCALAGIEPARRSPQPARLIPWPGGEPNVWRYAAKRESQLSPPLLAVTLYNKSLTRNYDKSAIATVAPRG